MPDDAAEARAGARGRLPLSAGLRVLFVSRRPAARHPQALSGSTCTPSIRSSSALTGEPAAIAALARDFGVAVNRVELPGGDYTMDHSAVVFLLDATRAIVAIFTPPFDVAALARDLKRAAPYLTGAAG